MIAQLVGQDKLVFVSGASYALAVDGQCDIEGGFPQAVQGDLMSLELIGSADLSFSVREAGLGSEGISKSVPVRRVEKLYSEFLADQALALQAVQVDAVQEGV